jgi:Carboxypeptidase regulatory-like domain
MYRKPVANTVHSPKSHYKVNEHFAFARKTCALAGRLVCLLIAMVLGATSLQGQQTTATLGGRVFDSQSKVIRNAAVVVTSVERGTQWHSTTNADGDWQVQSLPIGHYSFEVKANGFKALEHAPVELQVSDQKFVDATLSVGATSETIVVTSATPLIDTTAAISGTVISTEQLEEVPSVTNSPVDLVKLVPGGLFGQPSGGPAHLYSNNSESEVTVNASGSVNYQVEGGTNTFGTNGQIAFIPPMSAVGELRVTTNAYDASIGRTETATLDMTFKSGGKKYHGELYEINHTSSFDARAYNSNPLSPVPPVHYNEFGGTVGGPISIPKLYDGAKHGSFFFFSYDGIRTKAPSNPQGRISIPTMLERQGDFSQSFVVTSGVTYGPGLSNTAHPFSIYDPASIANDPTPTNNTTTNRTVFPGDVITTPISPAAKAIYALLPPPTDAGDGQSSDSNNYISRAIQINPFNSYILRVDKAWNENNHSYVALRRNQEDPTTGNSPFGASDILDGTSSLRRNLGLTIDHTWVVSPSLVVDLRGNVTNYKTNTVSASFGLNPASYGFSSALIAAQITPSIPALTGLITASSSATLGTAQAPSYENDLLYEGVGTVTKTIGKHTVKVGTQYLVQQQSLGNQGTTNGTFGFANVSSPTNSGSGNENWTTPNPLTTPGPGTGSPLASFFLGLPTSGSVGTPAESSWSQPYIAGFGQDDWRVTNKLTLNLGLRWDEQLGLTERHNKFWSIYDPNLNLTAITAVAQPAYASAITGSSTNLGVQLLQQYRPDPTTFVARGGIEYAGVNGTSRNVTQLTGKFFQPRVGFAYAFNSKTVLRGGFGRFVNANFVSNHGNQTGYSATTPFTGSNNNFVSVAATLANPFPNGLVQPTGNSLGIYTQVGSATSFYQAKVPRQYNDEISLKLQQQVGNYLLEIGGVFSGQHGISVGYDNDLLSQAAWQAAFGPAFDSTGRPLDTLAGNTPVTNPFKGAPYITTGLVTASTVNASQLALPNPLGDVTINRYTGTNDAYMLQTKAEKRFNQGFGFVTSFTWGKNMSESSRVLPQQVSQSLKRQLSTSDVRFIYSLAPTYDLPIGRGKSIGTNMNRVLDGVVGGWRFTAVFNANSGTPLSLPTNGAFFEGGDPGSGFTKSRSKWFDTSKFQPFPNKSTTTAALAALPAWTGVLGLPGASYTPTATDIKNGLGNGVYNDFNTWQTNNDTTFGDVRNPAFLNCDIGLRKIFTIKEEKKFELRMDAFNAPNHPIFAGPSTSVTSIYFGALGGSLPSNLTQSNTARVIQFGGRLYY